MNTPDDTLKFANAPVIETVLGVQFEPLPAFRSQHYGWLWQRYLEPLGWMPIADEKPLPEYTERFDDVKLKLTKIADTAKSVAGVRMKLRSSDRTSTLQIQPDKLYLSWGRTNSGAPDYEAAKPEFDRLFELFEQFAEDAKLGAVRPNLWEVTYVNQVPAGPLWSEPKDWHRVLPKLFPTAGPVCDGVRFATYDGTWHFEIEPKRGRIHLRVAKMVVNQSPQPVLFIMLIARGEINAGTNWSEGLQLGHDACVKLFGEVTSEEAKAEWGRQP